MYTLILPFFTIIGFASFFSRCLKTPLSLLLFATTALIGVLQFLFAITGYLQQGSFFILVLGTILFIVSGLTAKEERTTISFYLMFSCFIVLFAWGLRFRSIDDYSFWGVMSKYLFIFNQLPTNHEFISATYLTYTPGMGCIHYLFYFAVGKYSQIVGYVAQGAILLSALMVLFDRKDFRTSILEIAVAYIILNVGFGTLLARMEVDGYVAACVFAITWLIYKRPKHVELLVFFPILFLSLIKEIGLFFGVLLVIALFFTSNKSWKSLLLTALTFMGLFCLKWIWLTHCHHYGFNSFSQAIHLSNALSSLNPLNTYFHPAQWLFIKGVFLGQFGHVLAWPNLFSYSILLLIWHELSLEMNREHYVCALQLKWFFVAGIVIYLIMLYLLQAIVFEVGHSTNRLLDFQRYFNMLLIPFCLFSVLIYFQEKMPPQKAFWNRPLPIAIVVIALTFIISGKIERNKRYYLPNTIYPLVNMVQEKLPVNKTWTLCLDNPPQPTYQTTMPLAYFLLPNKVVMFNKAATCSYVMRWSGNLNTSELPTLW